MKMKKRFLSILLSLVMALGLMPGMSLTAFAETENVTGISLNKTTLSTILDTNRSGNILTATVTPSNAADKTVVWTCSDSTVVEARPNSNLGDGGYQNLCYLRTLKAGTATITVTATNGTDDTSDDQSATCTVTVYDPYPIGTVWKLGDTINLHGAWYRDPLGTAVYVYHSKDAEGKVPTDLQLIGSSVAEWRDVIPVSEYLDESKTDGYPIIPYTEDRKGSLRLSIPEDKKGETPLGIKLASGKGTASNPYVFELAYKAAPTVTAPTAKNLTYTGSAQALVTAGEATGGKMYYALGENATTAPADNLYTTSIPTATEAGTYYVWYKVKGDGNHNDTEPVCITVTIGEKADPDNPTPQPPVPEKPANQKYKNKLRINAGLKFQQTGSKITGKWGKVTGANLYEVYGSYCNKKAKLIKTVKGYNKNKLTIKKLNGKKLKLKKNYKFYVVAYKKVNGKKTKLAKSLIVHIVGRKNTTNTNVKSIKLNKKSYTLKKGRTAKIKPRLVLVDKKKKTLSKKHGPRFRYASSNKSVATVTKGGKIKARKAGKCTVYVYAINGCAKKIRVNVR